MSEEARPKQVEKVKSDDEKTPEKFKIENEEFHKELEKVEADNEKQVAGIDLKLAPDGRVFCLEVNPSPVFSYYEQHTGQPIADAVARLLMTRNHA